MKKTINKILSFLLILFVTSSCFQDKSNLDVSKIDDAVIESDDMPSILRVDYLGEVNFKPNVKIGNVTNPDKVTYRWEINQTPGYSDMVVIGNKRELDTIITNHILPAAYTLLFTVRDERYGLEYQKAWPLYVSSAFREGIVVADTKDGQTSDINLIMDNSLTAAYDKGKRVMYNIWKTATGQASPSLIKSIEYALHKPSPILTKNLITAIYEDNNINMINCEDYSVFKNADQIFPSRDGNFKPSGFTTINNGYWVLLNNNVPYVSATNQMITAFMMPVSGVQSADNGIVIADNSNGSGPYALWYNAEAGKFYNVAMTFTTPATGGTYTNQGVFDPQNVPGRTAIAGDVSIDGVTATMLMKNNSTSNYEIFAISFSYTDANYNQTPSAPKLKVEIPAALTPIINSAVSVFFNMFDPVMFVATANKVYAVNFGGGVVSYQEVYTSSTGTIAKAKLYVQGRFGLNQDDFNTEKGPIFEAPLALNTKAIVLAINQGTTQGTIEVIPQSNTATGVLNAAQTLKYTGFGRILDFTFQGQ